MTDQINLLYKLYLENRSVSIDSRTIKPGSIFFGLKGESFNGNAYAKEALEKGAVIAVIDDPVFREDDRYLLVDNSLDLLQQLALKYREQLDMPVIAITGSNGKTTTKELLNNVLIKKYNIFSTEGNLNNHIGVPLSILSIAPETEIAIIEMGANHIGEIRVLCQIAKPQYGLITNIGKAHLEGFGSYEGIIRAKNELYDYLRENKGSVFVNMDDPLLMELSGGIKNTTYGSSKKADCQAHAVDIYPFLTILWQSPEGEKHIKTRLYGSYNFQNILSAICIGSFFKVSPQNIIEGIQSYIPSNNRSQIIRTGSNIVYLDAYNANPSSMELVLNYFNEFPAENKTIIIGDMFELGKTSEMEHIKVLEHIKKLNFKEVMLVGERFFKVAKDRGFMVFKDTGQLLDHLKKNPVKNSSILVKGSRMVALEKILEVL